MKLLTKPKVYLVSKPSVDWDQVAAFLADEDVPGIPDSIRAGDDESSAIIEISARLCYMSFGRGRRDIADFINNLLSSKDGSVFEHVNYGFVFTGVSRSLTHELVRHRAGLPDRKTDDLRRYPHDHRRIQSQGRLTAIARMRRPVLPRIDRLWLEPKCLVRDAVPSKRCSCLISLFSREFAGKLKISGFSAPG